MNNYNSLNNNNNKCLSKMKWKSDFDKSVVLDNFTDRNWIKSQTEGIFLYFYVILISK